MDSKNKAEIFDVTENASATERALAFEKACRVLQTGHLVGIPTETVYGLAGNAFDLNALTQIFQAKERPLFDPLICHIAEPEGKNIDILSQLDESGLIDNEKLTDAARQGIQALISVYWPGPLTLILPRGKRVHDLVTSGLDHVAIRMPAHPAAQELLKRCQFPLAAPSANRFGRISPTQAAAVFQELGDRISMILDGGQCQFGLESTVVRFRETGEPVVLRLGALPLSQIESIVGANAITASANEKLASPGTHHTHYAPRKPLLISDSLLPSELTEEQAATYHWLQKNIGILRFRAEPPQFESVHHSYTLSSLNGFREAAQNFFKTLRALDMAPVDVILAESPFAHLGISKTSGLNSENLRSGLGFALEDRLKRASSGYFKMSSSS